MGRICAPFFYDPMDFPCILEVRALIPFDRRALLKSLAAAPFAAIQRTEADTTRWEKAARFDHGVASGDPAVDSVVIWTRVSGLDDALEVQWELATDTAFKQKVATGTVWTSAHRDFTVKAVPNGLAPGQRYFYRFKAGDSVSVMGRTRTLPVGSLQSLGIAVASCSNFAFGYFNAYDAIAHDKGIEFVLHLGDYIYEYGVDGWGAEVADSLGRRHEPGHEIVSLQDYRQRHAQYKTDAGSQAMHAAHPLLMVWDDHESASNPWVGGAQNHQTHTEGLWRDRRAA